MLGHLWILSLPSAVAATMVATAFTAAAVATVVATTVVAADSSAGPTDSPVYATHAAAKPNSTSAALTIFTAFRTTLTFFAITFTSAPASAPLR